MSVTTINSLPIELPPQDGNPYIESLSPLTVTEMKGFEEWGRCTKCIIKAYQAIRDLNPTVFNPYTNPEDRTNTFVETAFSPKFFETLGADLK